MGGNVTNNRHEHCKACQVVIHCQNGVHMAKPEEQVTKQRNRGKSKKCAIAECPSVAYSRGWCQKHYMRFWRHGDPQCSDLTMHGQHKTDEYKTWCSIIGRCENPNNPRFSQYGGRGVTICERWRQSFITFLSDLGQRPSRDHSIDRIDNNRGYEPENCRWATRKEQQRNRRTTRFLVFNGERRTLCEWSERMGIPERRLRSRIAIGWSDERALSEPFHENYSNRGRSTLTK